LCIATVKKIKNEPSATKPKFRIIVDEKTGLKLSLFHQTKDRMMKPTCWQFHKRKLAGKPAQHVRLENPGKNKKLKLCTESVDWKLNVKFEFTARDAPQQRPSGWWSQALS
jgi:hypothetical protein